jgi:hypothetical protein
MGSAGGPAAGSPPGCRRSAVALPGGGDQCGALGLFPSGGEEKPYWEAVQCWADEGHGGLHRGWATAGWVDWGSEEEMYEWYAEYVQMECLGEVVRRAE